MRISDIMTTNVVTIPSNTSLADARKIMDAHRIRRVPVVDKGHLMGIVSKDALDRAGPSKLTTFSVHELTYLLHSLTVKEVMIRDVVTISPDAGWEEGAALAQSRKVGALVVMDDSRLVGIVTTVDYFLKILNPLLGIGVPGKRIHVHKCGEPAQIADVMGAVSKLGMKINAMFSLIHPELGTPELTLQLDIADASKVIQELSSRGFDVHERMR